MEKAAKKLIASAAFFPPPPLPPPSENIKAWDCVINNDLEPFSASSSPKTEKLFFSCAFELIWLACVCALESFYYEKARPPPLCRGAGPLNVDWLVLCNASGDDGEHGEATCTLPAERC